MNAAARQFAGYCEEEAKGRHYFSERFLPEEEIPKMVGFFEAMKTNIASPDHESQLISCNGEKRIFRLTTRIIKDSDGTPSCFIITGIDITEQRRMEKFLRLLTEVNKTIAGASDEPALLEHVCELAIDKTEAKLACLMKPDNYGWFQVIAASGATDYLKEIKVTTSEALPEGRGIMAEAWRKGIPVDVASITRHKKMEPWRKAASRYGFAASISFPVMRGNKVWAVFTVYYGEDDLFDDALRGIVSELSKDISFGLDLIDKNNSRHDIDALNTALLQNLTVGIVVMRFPERFIESSNERVLAIFRAPDSKKFMERSPMDFYFDEYTFNQVTDMMQEIYEKGNSRSPNVAYKRFDGKEVIIDLSGQIIRDSADGFTRIVWTLIDVTERYVQERSIEKLNAEHQNLLLNTKAGIHMVSYPELSFVEANPAFLDIIGYSDEKEILGCSSNIIYGDESEGSRMAELSGEVIKRGFGSIRDLAIRRKDGNLIYVDISGQRFDDPFQWRPRIIWTSFDVTERHNLAEELEKQALTDALTRLPNRRALDAELEKAISRVKRHGNILAIVMIDLDGFKPVNDTLGHPAGDKLLQEFSVRLRSTLRHTDYVARLGGDEFVVLIEDCVDVQEVVVALQKIGSAISRPFMLNDDRHDNKPVHVGLSAGVCLYPLHHQAGNSESLLRYADQALYHSKNHKHDRLNFWFFYKDLKESGIDS